MTQHPVHGGPLKTECEITGEHQGDPYEQDDVYGVRWERWTCCDETGVIGEVFDCDTCDTPGVCLEDEDLPPGWVENDDGAHCEQCAKDAA